MVSLDTLNAEQQDKLKQYQTITQIQDLEEALGQLIEYNWNLERAIQHVYENTSKENKRKELEQEVASTVPAAGAAPRSTATSASSSARKKPSLLLSILLWPFGMAWNITWSILSLASRIIMARPVIQERKRDPRVLAVEFVETFERNYGPRHIEFFRGGYSQALEKARKDLRFMLVLLHSDDHDDTEAFCRDTLTAERLINFIRDKKIIVWAGNVRETEAHKVSHTLKASTYPFMSLVALQGTSTPRMAVIERIEGTCHPEELISQIDIAMDRHGAVVNRLLNERQQREMERQLMVDQDAAFNESLKQDQEKARLAEEEKQRQQAMEEEKMRQQQLAELQEQKRQQYIRYLFAHLPQEPKSNCARLNFRLANGDRVIRQFDQNATVDDLYRFVEVYPLVKEHGPCMEENVEAPTSYTHVYKFTIHTPYPRMEFPPSLQKLVDIKSLWPSATLVVEDDADQENEE
ncbi:hypothetical protein [Parasitella parasitica]|uniref:UBX domain-containing protein n=1 Tax=Parasitella parasitica TaxID=35722 RepID=A0A0B7NVG7_9FUNG|nr:hypothetical protein [Parasitella parasitica]